MQSRLEEIRALDAEVVAISSDDVEACREIAEAYGLEFSLLADPEFQAIDAFGLRHEEGGMGGDVARPATFILDREGRVAWRRLTDNWRIRPRPAELIEALAAIP